MYSRNAFDSCSISSSRDLTTSPIDTMPTSRPLFDHGKMAELAFRHALHQIDQLVVAGCRS